MGVQSATMSAAALRGYVKTLRVKRGATQAELAEHIGMPLTTYKDWERGVTKDIKTPFLLRAVQFLRGSIDQVAGIPEGATAEDGARLADQWLNSPLAPAVAEAEASGDAAALERFNRYLSLVAGGMAPDDAARAVLAELDH
jgi:transcriptional regulator with XRE-family HTH domain